MTRTIELELNKFPTTPRTLRDEASGAAVTQVNVRVKQLMHHYFLMKYGSDVEDRGVYEYESCLKGCPDWRFKGDGIGADKESKRNASNELGKAFARWFASEHLGHTYFTPIDHVLERETSDGSKWTRKAPGDLPDYVCGSGPKDLNVLEAKGSYDSVTFKTKKFQSFREQVQRVQLLDASGTAIQVKGFISFARWATEKTRTVRSKLLVEDPMTDGRPAGPDGYPPQIGRRMVLGHYASVFDALQLPVHAESIRSATALTTQQRTNALGVWECVSAALRGRRFIGGILPVHPRHFYEFPPWIPLEDASFGQFTWSLRRSPFVLWPPLKFFGIEEHIFNGALLGIRRGVDDHLEIASVDVPSNTGSLSLLRDGTILGPANYFEPVDVREF